ncbi:Uncharacterised protein [Enterobacter hormaechei]|nr:Uncharacterised protein [Enterobacter hormaechei]SAD74548.1 Uncharacterised protein [Enterobacter cloacae]VAG14366.1 Uncharacterised protein [Enterobacter hormaechei]
MFVHAATVNGIETANLLYGAAVVIQHHAALSGVSNVLIIPVQDRHILQLIRSCQIEKLVSKVRFG